MNPQSITRFRTVLAEHAAILHQTYNRVPLDVTQVCRDMRIRLSPQQGLGRFKAYLAEARDHRHAAEILYCDEMSGTDFARFCIMHEIGHFLLSREFSFVPEDRGEYWELEEVIDEFARITLVPEAAVGAELSLRRSSAQDVLAASIRLSEIARVPWIQSTRRIADLRPETCGLRVGRYRGELIVLGSTLPRNKERRRKIRAESRFFHCVNAMLESDFSGRYGRTQVIGVPELRDSHIPSVRNHVDAAIIPRGRGEGRDVLMISLPKLRQGMEQNGVLV